MKKTKTKTKAASTSDATGIVTTRNVSGVAYQLRYISCGKDRCRKGCAEGRASHGPYWYRGTWTWNEKKKTNTRAWKYLGKKEPTLDDIVKDIGGKDVKP